jgi:outer membrane protein OmpA-like peptidoglycan-associated protein
MLAGIVSALAPSRAEGCGFKVSGALGAVRFDNVKGTPNPMAILMYRNEKSASASKVITPTLERVLAKVGHHTEIAESEAEFARYIKLGEWPCDVHKVHKVQAVIVDIDDAKTLGNLDGRSTPAVIPIVSTPSQYDREKRKSYPVILTPSARPSSHLPAIEKVARTLRKQGADMPLLASATDRAAIDAGGEDRTPIRTAEGDRTPIASGPEAGDDAARAPIAAGADSDTGLPAEPVAKAEPKPEPVAAKVEPKPEPVAKIEPKPEPVAKVEPKPEPVAKVEPKPEPVAARVKEPDLPKPEAIAAPRSMSIPEDAKVTAKPQEIFFQTASNSLNASARSRLSKDLAWLQKNGGAKLRLEAHTDSIGPSEYNLALSTRRGDAVQQWFVAKGVSADRLEVIPLGEEDPVYQPPTNGRNRCVVVKRVE